MGSSPVEEVFARITELYEEALTAAGDGDYERVQQLVTQADPLLEGLPEPGMRSDAEHKKHRRTVEVFNSLLEAVVYEREQTMRSLGRAKQGQRALAGYGNRLEGSGARLERDG